ncbi:uncharacterized protein LOC112559481 isoform X2 [Pomacea canaliculata]|uniref:uncharacterized protein LOC112559481 isoform X2 n=1 Tax=Pomacea canaliculata TaxID=400727 RepID=UPI000D7394A4|nr:uncharacterized protein LOC112559481 isoform X2 [Pomacea canaliculata]XP_025086581.1 uncharacterized protein LOC112559481 isoform X2 [Pomacea canaliculata]XP_025086590.1 uncharacterized protein LOC112559481 isoform X2 [Pomacea canaliculata]
MADTATVVEGKIKYREGKKWKSRWCVLKKPSPVADCLQLLLYKDVHESLRAGGRVKTSLMLEGYYGLESGFSFDKEVNVLAIICQKHIAVMAFDNRENLILFEVKIRRSLGQEFQFPVQLVKVPSGSRLSVEGVRLLIHGLQFCLTAHVPPRILHSWNVTDLRRFGTVDGKFCFEGGSRCGKGTGAHALQTDQAEEITEILRLNSLGSSSASFKPSNNRSSQLLDYSLASPEALWPPPGAHSPGPDRTGMLACCHGVASAEDEFGCRKRHSVSVTDFHRSGAASFQDKLRLMSIENLERQRLMAIYDVPPKYPRKLVESSHSSKPDSESALESSNDAASSDPAWKSSVQQHSAVVGSDQCHVNKHTGHLQGNTVPIRTARVITSPNGREYCIPRSLNTTVFDSIVNAQVDSTKRTEALQKLQKQESHLHQEIILLDQMLQGCHPEGDAETLSINTCGSLTLKKDLAESEIHSMEHSSCSSTPAQITQKAASLPPKIGASIRKETYYSTGQAGHLNSLSDNCMLPLKEQDRNGDLCGSPLSPHLRSKLEKIPLNSHLNTPLPYVNLAKYDQEMDSGHVYLPGNGSSDGSHVALGHRLHRNLVGGSLANLGASRGRVGITPSRCFSETHIGPGPLDQKRVSSVHPSSKNNAAAAAEEFKLSGNILQEMDDIPPPTTYAPPVPYPRPHTATVTAAFSLDLDSPPSTQAPPVPSSPSLIVSFPQREPIYANEPVSSPPVPPPRKRSSTPPLELPPELPPKGPVLLRKTKQRSQGFANINNDFTPPVPARSRSRSVGSQGKFYGHDNSPVPNSPTSSVSDAGSVQMEENYLSMGSPKSQPRSKAKECLQSNGKETETVLIPATVFITNSPKTRCRGVSAAVSRGNADVLSGYMDMANMFVEETKTDSISNRPKLEPPQPKELHNSEEVDSSQVNAFGESNYMEMSTFSPHPPHPPQRKSVVLKNLEVLQTYVSTTPAGEFTRTSYNQVFSTSNLSTEHDNIPIYGARPAIPFTNLKSFEQKQNKSYVNTFIPSREYNVPLPEPPKKEEGFFARLMRRNSKDKGTTHSQENLNATKNRTSVFERSLSEQGDQEEKTNYKLKLGRRRSASFPNRLSFQETSPTATAPSKRDAPPPLPPSLPKPTTPVGASQSLCIHAEESSNQSNASTSRGAAHQSNPTDTSSVHDLSDDSDLAPLLKANVSKSELQVLTVLHMQQDIAVPLARTCSDLTAYKITHSSLSSSESSKTDDEKLQDLKRQSLVTDIAEIKAKMTLPLGKPMLSAKEEAKAIALHVASIPPFIPPKMKKTQLSPVTEVGSPVGHTQSPPLLSSSSHPHPLLPSAPNQDEAIYVDMKELLPQRGPALPAAASLHPYNCPREQKQRARATLRITPAVQDEDGNIWVPRHDPDPGGTSLTFPPRSRVSGLDSDV